MISSPDTPDSDIPCCAVCLSPAVTSFHFGSRTCKACAAFFRRTVALNVQYSCTGQGDCFVNYEKRMICKKCRFERCIAVEMNPDLVRSKGYEQKQSISECSNSPSTSTPSIQEPTSSTKDWDTDKTIHWYTKLESNLNDRRRILYGNDEMTAIFMGLCECPYDRKCLREADFQQKDHRPGVVTYMDYVRGLPHFDDLCPDDQNMLYRYCIGIDHILNSAWYSIQVGTDEHLSLCPDGHFIRMEPLPPSYEDYPDKDKLKTEEQRNTYRCFVPGKINHWFNIIKPMEKLDLSFQEFSLLKALASWHTSYHKLSTDAKPLAELEKNKLIHALLQLNTGPDRRGAERLGELLLFMTNIFDEMHNMMSSLIMITTFPLFHMDPLLSNILDYKKW